MKKSELFFSALRVPVDYIMVFLAGLMAYYLRFSDFVQDIRPVLQEQERQFLLQGFVELLLVVSAFVVLVFAIEGLYDIRSTKRFFLESFRVLKAVALSTMILIILIFLNPDWFASRFVILTGAALSIAFVTSARLALSLLQEYLLISRAIGTYRLLLVGVGGFCSAIKKNIEFNKRSGYKIVGHIKEVDIERIERIKKMRGIDEIIQCSPEISRNELAKLKDYAMHNRVVFKYVPTLLQTANFEMQIFLGEPVIEIKNTPLDGWGKINKRIFDIIGATVGITLFSPIMLIAALATWLDSGRPVIFLNRRVGHKREFDLYKFRYMKKEYCHGKQFSNEHNQKALNYLAELIKNQSIKKGPLYKIKDDPRKTKVGAFLERFSIDELPQFFNVLKGNMSLVGPRPHQPIEVEKYADYQRRVLTIKPGITGMAQVSGRSDLKFEDEVRLDIFYIENWSLWGDVKIILKTIPALLKKRKN
ncbi:MAG TPA: sugar transferase [Candidatus Moranbacteria bacterium]|nr:sugar transferase [Candidatus Moranbacteria bacterium]